ncbi:hypothetical protein CKQ54_06105 [Rahnella variigena]|uniref:Uncharacterized protein n=1 Tax=Rahnella variigena TaxID=574964 RepID=A0ABX9PTU5_9GAMM|nr:hypothetical protein D6D38_09590 [Rahnella variigena]RKF67975.1 hypothetical protein CKQ54_06105 [Rahnella variigena]
MMLLCVRNLILYLIRTAYTLDVNQPDTTKNYRSIKQLLHSEVFHISYKLVYRLNHLSGLRLKCK